MYKFYIVTYLLIFLKLNLVSDSSISSSKEEIEIVLLKNYNALNKKDTSTVVKLYHPQTNLPISKKGLDKYLSKYDVKYKIEKIRFIGSDLNNFIVIYNEETEFRKKGDLELLEKVSTEVIMVFRKYKGKFKIYTSQTLKPGSFNKKEFQ